MTEELVIALLERNEAICLALIDGFAQVAVADIRMVRAEWLLTWIQDMRCNWPDPLAETVPE